MGLDVRAAATIAVGAVCLAACVYDVRLRRIPNALTLGAALAGLAFHVLQAGIQGAGASVAGCLVGALLFFPFFALGGLGAGDVKLVAAIGAWLGPAGALWVSLYAAIAGGAMALVVALARGYAPRMLSNLWHLAGYWRLFGIRPVPGLTLGAAPGPRLPYALPIAVGAFLALWLR